MMNEGIIPEAPDDLQKLIDQYDRSEVEKGMDVEQEHNGGKDLDVAKSPLDTLKIVLAHMKEDPMYYTHLKDMEDKNKVNEGETTTFGKLKIGQWYTTPDHPEVRCRKVERTKFEIGKAGWKYPSGPNEIVFLSETVLAKFVDFKKLKIGDMFRFAANNHAKPSPICKKISNTKYRDMESRMDLYVDGKGLGSSLIMVIPEGTTSRSSFEYEKSPTNTYKAPEMNPRHFAQDGEVHTEMGDETEMDKELDHPDPQYASSSRARTEGDSENKKLKGRDLLWDEEQCDDDEEIDDANLGEEIARMLRAMRGI